MEVIEVSGYVAEEKLAIAKVNIEVDFYNNCKICFIFRII